MSLNPFWKSHDKGRIFYGLSTILLAFVVLGILAGWLVMQGKKHEIVLFSGQKGGIYLEIADELAKQITAANPEIVVKVETTAGSRENLRRIIADSRGRAMAIVQNDVHLDGEVHDEVRSLLPLHSGVLHFIVREESEITSVSDLRGKTIAGGEEGSGTPPVLAALLKHYEIEDKVKIERLSLKDACHALEDGQVDAIILAMGLKAEGFEDLIRENRVRFVGIGKTIGSGSEIEGFLLSYPFVGEMMIPKYTYAAPTGDLEGIPEQATPAVSLQAVLVASRSLADHHAYRIARTLVENRSALARGHPSAARITGQFDPGSLQYPVHRGSNRYLHRNDPSYLRQNAELFGFLLSLVIALGGLFFSMRKWMTHRKKDRIDEYYIRLDELLTGLRGSRFSLDQLQDLDEELWKMNREAVRQLASEKLIANESFRIFQNLLSEGRNEVRRRIGSLTP